MSVNIVGDFGGTNARLAVSTQAGISGIREYKCADFHSPVALITRFLEDAEIVDAPERGLFAIAGATEDPEKIVFTNGPWKQTEVSFTDTDIKSTSTINDFDAICLSTAALRPEETEILSAGREPFYPSLLLTDPKTFKTEPSRLLECPPEQRFITIGPGTGLGVASGMVTKNGQFMVLGGEGGHSDFSANTPQELELKEFLESMDVIVTNETIASGTGLGITFNAISEIRDLKTKIDTAAELPQLLSSDTSPEVKGAVRWTYKLFAETLGKCTAGAALVNDARTVFIAGGVIPKLGENFHRNAFLRAFKSNDLGANNELDRTPILLITHKQPGLLGTHSHLMMSNG